MPQPPLTPCACGRAAPRPPPCPRSDRRGWQRHIKRSLHTLRHPEFQIMYVPEVPPGPTARGSAEWHALKRIAAADKFYS